MFDENLILAIYFVSIALANRVLYFYNDSKNKRKRIDSLKSFVYVQKYLRFSTLTIALLSIYSHSSWLYKIPGIQYVFTGASLCALSIIILFIARFNLNDNYSPCYDMKAPKDFIHHGVYKIIRHPIYFSNLLLVLGVFLATGSAWIIVNFSILFIYYLVSAIKEENQLIKKFPKYKRYQAGTSMFIPGYKIIKK